MTVVLACGASRICAELGVLPRAAGLSGPGRSPCYSSPSRLARCTPWRPWRRPRRPLASSTRCTRCSPRAARPSGRPMSMWPGTSRRHQQQRRARVGQWVRQCSTTRHDEGRREGGSWGEGTSGGGAASSMGLTDGTVRVVWWTCGPCVCPSIGVLVEVESGTYSLLAAQDGALLWAQVRRRRNRRPPAVLLRFHLQRSPVHVHVLAYDDCKEGHWPKLSVLPLVQGQQLRVCLTGSCMHV